VLSILYDKLFCEVTSAYRNTAVTREVALWTGQLLIESRVRQY